MIVGSLTREVALSGGMSGIQLCRRLKAEPTTAHTKVVMLTSLRGEEHWGKALLAGVDAYVTTPTEGDELERLLCDLLERGAGPPPTD